MAFVGTALLKPLKRKTPTTYFVNSMSDLFHEDVPDEWIDRVFAVMALCPQHTFQVLTKRAARMRAYFNRVTVPGYTAEMAAEDDDIDMGAARFALTVQLCGEWNIGRTWSPPILPLDNVWLGVSCEDQRRANERIPDLLATPAAVRFVSAEPLLGPVDFTKDRLWHASCRLCVGQGPCAAGGVGIDWVIVGGESGHGARPMKREWADSIVSQCREANVACFVKQLGAAYCDEKNGVAGALIKAPSEVAISTRLHHRKGADMAEWPETLCVREMPVLGI